MHQRKSKLNTFSTTVSNINNQFLYGYMAWKVLLKTPQITRKDICTCHFKGFPFQPAARDLFPAPPHIAQYTPQSSLSASSKGSIPSTTSHSTVHTTGFSFQPAAWDLLPAPPHIAQYTPQASLSSQQQGIYSQHHLTQHSTHHSLHFPASSKGSIPSTIPHSTVHTTGFSFQPAARDLFPAPSHIAQYTPQASLSSQQQGIYSQHHLTQHSTHHSLLFPASSKGSIPSTTSQHSTHQSSLSSQQQGIYSQHHPKQHSTHHSLLFPASSKGSVPSTTSHSTVHTTGFSFQPAARDLFPAPSHIAQYTPQSLLNQPLRIGWNKRKLNGCTKGDLSNHPLDHEQMLYHGILLTAETFNQSILHSNMSRNNQSTTLSLLKIKIKKNP